MAETNEQADLPAGNTEQHVRFLVHEVRNYLSAVLAGARTLQRASKDPQTVEEVAGMIESSVTKATRYFTELQELVRKELAARQPSDSTTAGRGNNTARRTETGECP
jgi:hypothetical protein